MQFYPLNSGYDLMPRVSGELAEQRLLAWQQGQTGIPMVDACMRSLQHTGYLNFRMRAMLVSFYAITAKWIGVMACSMWRVYF